MDVVQLLIIVVVLGLVWWLVTSFVPLPAPIKTVITVVAVLIICILLLQWAGLTHINLRR